MKQETIKIQQGNKTQLCLRPVLPDGTPIPDTGELDMVHAVYTINGHDVEMPILGVSDGYIRIELPETLPIAVYDVKVYGVIGDDERPWCDNRHAMFEIVQYGNGISYEQYYTDIVIIGLPDSEVEKLKAEYEAKRDEYQRLIDELNRGEVATKSDLGLLPGETVAGLIKAGGGGGGGLTPEQWEQIAKEHTLNEIKGMLTLEDGEVTDELQTLIPNEEETV